MQFHSFRLRWFYSAELKLDYIFSRGGSHEDDPLKIRFALFPLPNSIECRVADFFQNSVVLRGKHGLFLTLLAIVVES